VTSRCTTCRYRSWAHARGAVLTICKLQIKPHGGCERLGLIPLFWYQRSCFGRHLSWPSTAARVALLGLGLLVWLNSSAQAQLAPSSTPGQVTIESDLQRADNKTGVAWPSYRRMIEITGLSKNTVRRSIETLENPRKLISRIGKPFAGSCRYRVFPIVPPESRLEDSNSPTTRTIEALPIVPPVTHNSPSHGTSIVPPEGQEGSPKKEIQRRKSNREISSDGLIFADWFKSTLPATTNLGPNWRNSFAETFDELVRLDKRDPEETRV
jgi:hypothetical protein